MLTELRLAQGVAKIFHMDNTRQYIHGKIIACNAEIVLIMEAQRKEPTIIIFKKDLISHIIINKSLQGKDVLV